MISSSSQPLNLDHVAGVLSHDDTTADGVAAGQHQASHHDHGQPADHVGEVEDVLAAVEVALKLLHVGVGHEEAAATPGPLETDEVNDDDGDYVETEIANVSSGGATIDDHAEGTEGDEDEGTLYFSYDYLWTIKNL